MARGRFSEIFDARIRLVIVLHYAHITFDVPKIIYLIKSENIDIYWVIRKMHRSYSNTWVVN